MWKTVTCQNSRCGKGIDLDCEEALKKSADMDFNCPHCGQLHWFNAQTDKLEAAPGWFFTAMCIFYLVLVLAGIGVIAWLSYLLMTHK